MPKWLKTTRSIVDRRVLEILKRLEAAPASAIDRHLDLTDVAVRRHLTAPEGQGLVEQTRTPPKGRGRPSAAWSLTPQLEDEGEAAPIEGETKRLLEEAAARRAAVEGR